MPRPPAVFEVKKKWRLGYEAPDNHSAEWSKNYKTTEENIKAVTAKVTEDLKEKHTTAWKAADQDAWDQDGEDETPPKGGGKGPKPKK